MKNDALDEIFQHLMENSRKEKQEKYEESFENLNEFQKHIVVLAGLLISSVSGWEKEDLKVLLKCCHDVQEQATEELRKRGIDPEGTSGTQG